MIRNWSQDRALDKSEIDGLKEEEKEDGISNLKSTKTGVVVL